jgi:hypothetical protein
VNKERVREGGGEAIIQYRIENAYESEDNRKRKKVNKEE